jgi:hypothetical protein
MLEKQPWYLCQYQSVVMCTHPGDCQDLLKTLTAPDIGYSASTIFAFEPSGMNLKTFSRVALEVQTICTFLCEKPLMLMQQSPDNNGMSVSVEETMTARFESISPAMNASACHWQLPHLRPFPQRCS